MIRDDTQRDRDDRDSMSEDDLQRIQDEALENARPGAGLPLAARVEVSDE